MSMLWAFEKIMAEPKRAEIEDRALRDENEGVDEDATGPPTLRCRACNYEGPEPYCPRCLADTMVKIKIRRHFPSTK
jgi:hypothetical protein